MSKETITYEDTIEQDAVKEEYGYKSANLIYLGNIKKEFAAEIEGLGLSKFYGNISLNVPVFEPIPSSVILKHLDQYAPKWREQFAEFKSHFNPEKDKVLNDEQKELLKKTQDTIINCFRECPISKKLFNKFLSDNNIEPNDLVMVRSTGIHEDKADMANPGGNESFPCRANIEEISAAIGQVVASYIGEKSLSQRLILGDKTITELPVMPALVQQMVGEGVKGDNNIVYSGVIYSNSGSSRMQAAPGHGEYVVNSKGRVDNYYISTEDLLYSEIRAKDFRIQPKVDSVNNKISLERVENNVELKYQPSIPDNVVLYLHEFAKFIEKQYNKRMDIEFVYDRANNKVNIVQARAIPEGNRRGLEPSGLSPGFLGDNSSKLSTIEVLQVITPEVNRVAIISDTKQAIICNTIEEALTRYNSFGQNADVKAVIVSNPSPDTSHEAGVFNAASVAVMQVKDIKEVEKLLQSKQPIIVDPQHSKIYQIPAELFQGQNEQNIEEALLEEGILAKGIFASSLSSYVTTTKYDLPKVDYERVSSENSLQDKTLGKLVIKGQSGEVKSTKELLDLAYKVVSFKKDNQKEQDDNIVVYDLRQNLSTLSVPKIGSNNEELRSALGYILRSTIDAYKREYISQDLLKQVIISGTELSTLCDRMERKQDLSREEENKTYLEYFNVEKKFTGLIIGPGDSLVAHLKAKRYEVIAKELAPQVEGESKDYLIESLKLGDYLISDEMKQEWYKFCAANCATEEGTKRLGALVNKVVSFDVHEQWVNFIFADQFNFKWNGKDVNVVNIPEAKTSPEVMLQILEEDFNEANLEPVQEASRMIKSMESQISKWGNPSKFDDLYEELQDNIKAINEQLKWNKEASNLKNILILEQVNQLIGVMDKSIKYLERSTQYPDNLKDNKGNDLQVVRMLDLIKEFNVLMNNFVPDTYHENKKSLKDLLDKKYILKYNGSLTRKEFNLSPDFDVSKAIINSDIENSIKPKTIEDIFTLIHQNILTILNKFNKETNPSSTKQLPNLVLTLMDKIDTEVKNNGKDIQVNTNIKLDNNKILIEKHIPLREHSYSINIIYDLVKKECSLTTEMYSLLNEGGRLNYINLDTYITLRQRGIEFKTPYSNSISLELKVKNVSQVNEIVKQINEHINISYKLAAGIGKTAVRLNYINNFWQEKLTLLSQDFKLYYELKTIKIPCSIFTIENLMEVRKLDNTSISFFLENNYKIEEFCKEANINPPQFLEIYKKHHSLFQNYNILDLKLSINDLENIKEEELLFLSDNAPIVTLLNDTQGISLSKLLTMYTRNPEQAEFLVKYYYDVTKSKNSLEENHKILESIINDPVMLQFCMKAIQKIKDFNHRQYNDIDKVDIIKFLFDVKKDYKLANVIVDYVDDYLDVLHNKDHYNKHHSFQKTLSNVFYKLVNSSPEVKEIFTQNIEQVIKYASVQGTLAKTIEQIQKRPEEMKEIFEVIRKTSYLTKDQKYEIYGLLKNQEVDKQLLLQTDVPMLQLILKDTTAFTELLSEVTIENKQTGYSIIKELLNTKIDSKEIKERTDPFEEDIISYAKVNIRDIPEGVRLKSAPKQGLGAMGNPANTEVTKTTWVDKVENNPSSPLIGQVLADWKNDDEGDL